MQRLLNDDLLNVDDLTNLFLFARERCDGRESVQEIGDFVAHHTEREKGVITKSTRDFFAILQFHMEFFTVKGKIKIDYNNMPASTPTFLFATARRLHAKSLKADCGITKRQIQKSVSDLVCALEKKADGTYSASNLDEKQARLLTGLSRYVCSQIAFDGAKLAYDFKETLRSNGLLSKEDALRFEPLSRKTQLFAISIMHNTRIKLEDGTSIILRATPREDGVSIIAFFDTSVKKYYVGTSLFSVELSPYVFFEEPLYLSPSWDHLNIEINRNGKLTIL